MTTRWMAGLGLAACLGLAPAAGAHVPGTTRTTPGHEAALSIAAAMANLVYTPAKVGVAVAGLVGGAVAGLLSGGDVRAAYALWVPLAGGDYMIRPAHVDGVRPLAFFGSDYDDTPSRYDADGSVIYRALYGAQPPASEQQPAKRAKQPATSANQPPASAEQPSASAE